MSERDLIMITMMAKVALIIIRVKDADRLGLFKTTIVSFPFNASYFFFGKRIRRNFVLNDRHFRFSFTSTPKITLCYFRMNTATPQFYLHQLNQCTVILFSPLFFQCTPTNTFAIIPAIFLHLSTFPFISILTEIPAHTASVSVTVTVLFYSDYLPKSILTSITLKMQFFFLTPFSHFSFSIRNHDFLSSLLRPINHTNPYWSFSQ